MSVIRITESLNSDKSIRLKVDGRLDDSSIPTLDEVCKHHFRDGRKVSLDLEGLYYISREGRDFLNMIKDRVKLMRIPSFINLK
jgi:hypothetical protein